MLDDKAGLLCGHRFENWHLSIMVRVSRDIHDDLLGSFLGKYIGRQLIKQFPGSLLTMTLRTMIVKQFCASRKIGMIMMVPRTSEKADNKTGAHQYRYP